MRIEIKSSPSGYYDLFVDGELTVREESFAIVDQYKYALEHPDAGKHLVMGEIMEGADAIRAAKASRTT